MYIITSYYFSILLVLFIIVTVLFKPSLFKRFITLYFKLFGIDYYSKYFDNDLDKPFIWISLILFIILPFIAIPLILFILFIGRIIKILKN
jgi:hypothetical protein